MELLLSVVLRECWLRQQNKGDMSEEALGIIGSAGAVQIHYVFL